VRAGARPAKREHRTEARSLKTQQYEIVEVDVLLGELETGQATPSGIHNLWIRKRVCHQRPSSPPELELRYP
jgi:hypothetical protein